MLDARTLALALAVFCATFAAGWWLGIGNLASAVPTSWARPGEPVSSPSQLPSLPHVRTDARPGKGLTDDDELRDAILDLAKAYRRPTCGQNVRARYVEVASEYAEALMLAAGCPNFPQCRVGTDGLERVWRANHSRLDQQVAEAMASVHRAGGLSVKSFPGDVGRVVQVIAGTEFSSEPAPVCSASSATSRRFRIRFRR